MALSELEQRMISDVSTEAGWDLLEAFASQPREKPEDGNIGADMIADRLRGFGIPVVMHEPSLYLSLPIHAEVRASGRTFRAKPPAFCKSVPDGLTAPLIYLPAAKSSDGPLDGAGTNTLDPDRVAGKIVVTEGFALPMVVAALEDAGAAGVIAVNPGELIHWGTVSTIWGTPGLDDLKRLPKIPSAAVNRKDGDVLLELAKSGESVTLVTELDVGWFPSKLPAIEIPGTQEPEKFVLLHGHYDSWDVGVGDNGTGNACMLEVARQLWANRQNLSRSVRMAWWPGHSTGRYGGSAWYADTFAIDIAENCVIQMNCDSPGCRDATSYGSITMMPEVATATKDIVRDVTGQEASAKRPNRSSDYTFYNIGVSSAFMASSMMPKDLVAAKGWYVVGGCGGNIAWHTEADTMDVADADVLKKDMQLYLTAVVRHANAGILPYDWRATIGEFNDKLGRYQELAGDRFDLSPAQDALDALQNSLDEFYAAIDAATISEKDANDIIVRLARILVPTDFTVDPRFTHDPALNSEPLAAISAAAHLDEYGPDELGFAQAQLLRGRNRLVAAFRDAQERVANASKGVD